jgi:cytochrome c5
MSNEAHAASTISLTQKMIVILGGIIAPIFVICTMIKSPEAPKAAAEPSVDRTEVINNIKPLAVVELAAEDSGPKVEKSGEEIVNQSCAACHGAGMMGSPKLGDSGAWSARIAQGYETLTKHAIEGIRSMPARGGNPDYTDNEIAKAVAYMANQAGASFTPPASAEPEATEAPVAE